MRQGFKAVAVILAAVLLKTGVASAACQLTTFAELPVTMQGLRPMVPAKINGHEGVFLADSGAFYSMITPSTASELKLPLEPAPWNFSLRGVGGEAARVDITRVKTFTLAGMPIPNVQFLVTSGVGGDAAGLLGQNIFGLADVEYDLAGGAIRLMRPKGCDRADLAYWTGAGKPYSKMDIRPLEDRDRHTIGTAYVNGMRIRVAFDTGASTSALTLAAAARAGITPNSPGVVPVGFSGGIGSRAIKTWIAPFASFKIGDEEIKNIRLRISDIDLTGADMLLGADFFLSHRVYVSNSQRQLYFTYNGGPVFNLTAQAMRKAGASATSEPAPGSDPASKDQAPKDQALKDQGGTPTPDQPKDAEGFSRRGAVFASRHDLDAAIADFTRAVEMAPNEPRYVYQRAMARLDAHQPFLAMADLDQTLKLKPDDVPSLVARAQLRLTGQDRKGAVADLDAAAGFAPKEADIRLRLANIYERMDLLEQALVQYDLWIAAHEGESEMGSALNGRCWARGLLGRDLDKALGDCNRAVRMMSQAASPLISRGLIDLRRGEFDRAINDFNAVLALQPKSAWAFYGRGLAKLHKGAKAEGDADIAAAQGMAPAVIERAKTHGITPPQ